MAANKARIEITAVDRTRAAIQSATAGLKRLRLVAVSAAASIGVAFSAIRFAQFAREQAKAQDELAKMSRRLGESAERLKAFQLAASQTAGITEKQAGIALQRFTRRLGQAAQQSGELQDTLKRLGLNAGELSRKTPTRAFEDLARAIGKAGPHSEKLVAAFKSFDSEGAGLITTLLAISSEGLDPFVAKVRALRSVLDDVDLRRVEMANDRLGELSDRLGGLGAKIFAEMAVPLSAIIEQILDLDIRVIGLSGSFLSVAESASKLFEIIMNARGVVVDFFTIVPRVILEAWDVAMSDSTSKALDFAGRVKAIFVDLKNDATTILETPVTDAFFASLHDRIAELEAALRAAIDGGLKPLEETGAGGVNLQKLTTNVENALQAGADRGAKGMVESILDTVKNNLLRNLSEMIAGAIGAAGGARGGFWGGLASLFAGSFDSGGTVPGPMGAPRLALVHGGETILPTHKSGGSGNVTVAPSISISDGGDVEQKIIRGMELAKAAAISEIRQQRRTGRF